MAFDAITKILYLLFYLKFEIIFLDMKNMDLGVQKFFLVIKMSLDVMTLFGMFCCDFSWKSLIIL